MSAATKNEFEKLRSLVQKQDKTIAALRGTLQQDQEMIKNMDDEKSVLTGHISELEKMVNELAGELRKEKKNSAELEELVCALNQNRKSLEEQLDWLKSEHEKQQQELQQFSTVKKELAEARKGELQAIHHRLSNVAQGEDDDEFAAGPEAGTDHS